MKMEIGFSAPVAGVVSEVRVAKGQQVAAGELLLVIDASRDEAQARQRPASGCACPKRVDPLAPLFSGGDGGDLGAPDLLAADARARGVALAPRWPRSTPRSSG